MQKIISTLLFCFIVANGFAQAQKKVSAFLSAQYNKTIYDRTVGNNPWGTGLGWQVFFNTHSTLKPTLDITGSIYLENDKVLRLNPDATNPSPANDLASMVNIFAGSSFNLSPNFYVSLIAGPSFISGRTLLGIKPSFGFYFSAKQRVMAKISYINIFNRDEVTKEDFGSLSFSIGLKLF